MESIRLLSAHTPRHLSWRAIAFCCLVLICFVSGSVAVSAAAPAAIAPILLYDGALGTLPDAQGFTFLAVPSVSPTVSGGATILDTSSNKSTYAGYFSKP